MIHMRMEPGSSRSFVRRTSSRPLAQLFDFLEVCGGSGVLSEKMAGKGFVVGPIVDLSFSLHYDLTKSRVLEWLLFLVRHQRVKLL